MNLHQAKKTARELAKRRDEEIYILRDWPEFPGDPRPLAIATQEDLDTYYAGCRPEDIELIVYPDGTYD